MLPPSSRRTPDVLLDWQARGADERPDPFGPPVGWRQFWCWTQSGFDAWRYLQLIVSCATLTEKPRRRILPVP